MNFYRILDEILRQDMGGRGLLDDFPENPVAETAETLRHARRVLLLTGFPVRLPDGSFVGETDGPSGTANLAYAFREAGAEVLVVTDRASRALAEAAVAFRAPGVRVTMIPETGAHAFARECVRDFRPTHFISLERPGMARDNHYHSMCGEIIDDMLADTSPFLSEAAAHGAVTISIGDGGNEMGMGAYRGEIEAHVPSGALICARDSAKLALAAGVSNWWGWGIAALLSLQTGRCLLPTREEETELLHRVVMAGGVDGCTKERTETVDRLPLEAHLTVLDQISRALRDEMAGTFPGTSCNLSNGGGIL